MFWSQHHRCGPKQGVWPSGKDFDHRTGRSSETNLGPFGATNPIPLHCLDGISPIEVAQIFEQPVGVGRNSHHPLLHGPTKNRMITTLTAAFRGDFFVSENRSEGWTPVHRCLPQICQPPLI